MEVGQGQNWGCSAKGKKKHVVTSIEILSELHSQDAYGGNLFHAL
jgi:hypothetical protein